MLVNRLERRVASRRKFGLRLCLESHEDIAVGKCKPRADNSKHVELMEVTQEEERLCGRYAC